MLLAPDERIEKDFNEVKKSTVLLNPLSQKALFSRSQKWCRVIVASTLRTIIREFGMA